eukprot:2812142-Rhodomonas_salina.1
MHFASWTVWNIALFSSTGDSIYCPLPLRQSVVQILMIVPVRDPICRTPTWGKTEAIDTAADR